MIILQLIALLPGSKINSPGHTLHCPIKNDMNETKLQVSSSDFQTPNYEINKVEQAVLVH